MSAIFISHSSKDNAWAKRIATWLREQGYEGLFLDFDDRQGIEAGSEWREKIYRQLRLCRAVIALCSEHFIASQWCLSEVAIAVDQGKHLFPIRIREGTLPNLVQPIQAIDLREDERKGLEMLTQVLDRRLNWKDKLPWDSQRPPYPGLPAFQEKDAAMFFGRDTDIENLLEKLRSLKGKHSTAMLLVLGASGCGKSSLVRAGVVPQLRADADQSWIVIEPFKPDLSPFLALQEGLRSQFLATALDPPTIGSDAQARQLLASLQLLRSRSQAPEARVVLVIDQFEELLARDVEASRQKEPVEAREADRFLTFLHELLITPAGSVTVLATLRTDFLANFQNQSPELLKLASPVTLAPIRQEDYGVLVSGPADRAGLTLQPGLKERLMQESGRGDALPLLAFTLKELWKLRQKRGTAVAGSEGSWWDLTLKDYDDLGGVTGSVKEAAERAHRPKGPDWYEGRREEETAALREAFLGHLVRLSEDGPATKQPARWSVLPELSKPILREFVEARLLVAGKEGDTIEVAHEALLRTWPTLAGWLKDGRMELEQQSRVRRLCKDLNIAWAREPIRREAFSSLESMAKYNPQALQPAEETLVEVLANGQRRPWERLKAAGLLGTIGGEQAEAAMRGLLEREQLPQESDQERVAIRLVAIRLLETIGGEQAEAAMRGLLEREQLCQESDRERVAIVLEVLTKAASALKQIYWQRTAPSTDGTRLLLVPSATVRADGQAISTSLVTMRLLPSPRAEGQSVWFEELAPGVPLTMVGIPAGTFLMGSPEDELERSDHEGPQHDVTLDAFFLAQTPITQAQWRAVASWPCLEGEDWGWKLNQDPSLFQGMEVGLLERETSTDACPVESVSRHDAMEFCARLSQRTGRTYTLPSEAQWEYACRAGTTKPFAFGETITTVLANYRGTSTYGDGPKGEYREQTTPVGSFPANAWGLQDMHGNVWEWCLDTWHDNYVGAPTDGSAWLDPEADEHADGLLRGGSWFDLLMYCRSAYRSHNRSGKADSNVGFRVCCLPQDQLLDP